MNTMINQNFGHEGQTVEFKTSFYISAGNHDEDQQFVVFKAACAMMNADGGDIYIGVDDNGNIAVGPHYGVRGDIEKMSKICTNDAYARYINQRINTYFFDPKYVRGLMYAEETNSKDVIHIRVKKADKVVYLHKLGSTERLAYRREGASSPTMNKSMIAQRENSLSTEKAQNSASKKEATIRLRIQEAIELKKKIAIYGYSSSNSDTKTDRIVEPISFICDGRSIWAYEEAKEHSDPLRQFKVGRIDNVKVLDESCNHENCYQTAFVDAFEWTRSTKPSIHITILIGPSAKNRLVEECPSAINHLADNGDGQWLFDADVHCLAPVKRFCQEFKDSITVYAPDELKKELGLVDDDIMAENGKSICGKSLKERIKMALAILMPNMFQKNNLHVAAVL